MKIKPFTLPERAGSILVCGSSRSAIALFKRAKDAVKTEPEWTVSFSLIPIKGCDYIYSTDQIPLDIARSCRETMVVTYESAEGKTRSQEYLCDSDWQALRDIERQLLAMHDTGLWILPVDVRKRMLEREVMRTAVDNELSV